MNPNGERSFFGIRSVLLIAVFSGMLCIPKSYSDTEEDLRNLEQMIHQRINAIRSENQAAELVWNEEITSEARRHAQNMAARDFFSHEDPERGELSRRLDVSGIDWNRCSENIYREKGLENPAEDAIKSWMQSPGHKRNLLDPGLAETGIGAAIRRDGTIFVVQIFIRKFVKVKAKTNSTKPY